MNNLKDLLISPEPFIRVPLWQLQVPKWKKVLALTGYPDTSEKSQKVVDLRFEA
jgi:hypothetical protein